MTQRRSRREKGEKQGEEQGEEQETHTLAPPGSGPRHHRQLE